jgi:hypothetical protein
MIPVSGGPFGSNLGGTIWSRDEAAEGAAADEVGMHSVRRTMRRLIELARAMKSE